MDFGFGRGGGEDRFDDRDEFVPAHLPDPGSFLDGHEVLTGEAHVAARDLAHEVFETRGVYDVTFGYNLARLDLDRDHPEAGFRYARERAAASDLPGTDENEGATLRAEFTPTTEFCPAGESLALGAFRAFNGERDRHEYGLVRVRVDASHQSAGSVNRKLAAVEKRFVETGTVPRVSGTDSGADAVPTERGDRDGTV